MPSSPEAAFVWIWLPGDAEPIVCGRLDESPRDITFTYAQSYLQRSDAVAIYEPELPLVRGVQRAVVGSRLPLCIDDAMPDSWGRRLINYRQKAATSDLGEVTYLLESGSDRIGALDFQAASDVYVARGGDHPGLDELAEAARRIQVGEPLNAELEAALLHGTSVGGARPKALVDDGDRKLIAKFSSETDLYPVVQGEFVAMTLAQRCGLDVAAVELTRAAGRYALLVERFDRESAGRRRALVSALTILGLDTFPGGRYASYIGLADAIRADFSKPDATLRELFARISFNILCGNSDDHGRNHAAFVGSELLITPAYDICPQARVGGASAQAMAFTRGVDGLPGERDSRLRCLVGAARDYHLGTEEAGAIVESQVEVIRSEWNDVCDLAELPELERAAFWQNQFLNDHAFE